MSVAIVTDGAAALSTDQAADAGVTTVPMWLTVGGVPEPEGARELEALMREDDVTTSAPTPGEFENAIKEAGAEGDGVLVVTIASSMSATFQAASVAAAAVGGPVRVLDSATAGGAQALVVLAAAEAARQGATIDAVEARARSVAARVRLVASLPSLDHLVRSGRVPGIAGWAGRRLGINPLFEFVHGTVHPRRPALSRTSALDRLVGLVHGSRPGQARLHVVALHAMARPTADALLARVTDVEDVATAFVGEFGPVMVVHTGPGLVGLAWWWETDA